MRTGVMAFLVALAVGAPMASLAATDAEYDRAVGVDKGRSDGTLKPDAGLTGKSFTAPKGLGKDDCPVTFKFDTAETGSFPYRAAEGAAMSGVNVKITVSCDLAKCKEECATIKILQFVRLIDIDGAGKKTTGTPDSDQRKARSGWADPAAPSRGWRVDATDTDTDPYYANNDLYGDVGSNTKPATERDTPNFKKGDVNKGREFLTCAICGGGAKGRVMACLRWGFTLDKTGTPSFDPAPTALSPPPPAEAKDSADRWDKIAGNKPTNVSF